MSENPFSSFNVEMPKKYDEKIKQFCASSGRSKSREQAPFERQIDFWYAAFLLAANKELPLVEESDTYNVTPASILSTDQYRITHIQTVFLSVTKDIEGLADNRKVFDFALKVSNAGIPFLIQVLDDNDQRPLWNMLDFAEEVLG